MGRIQAEGLPAQLAGVPLARVLTSPYARCRQTVDPLAAARGLAIEDLGALGEGRAGDQVLALLPELAPAGAALCSHGDVIRAIVRALVAQGLADPRTARWAKGSTWLLELESSKLVAARYLGPPVPGRERRRPRASNG